MTGDNGGSGEHDPVRVLWLIKGLGPGGAEQLLVNQARVSSTALDVSVAYLVPWKNHLVADLAQLDIPASCLDAPREWDLRWIHRLRRLVLDERIGVIHVHSPYVAALSRLAVRTIPRRERPAVVYTEHNRWPRHSRLTRFANKMTLGLDDATVAVSEDVRSTMSSPRGHAIEVLVHGVDLDTLRAAMALRRSVREELDVADDEVLVCTVANFRKEKAYEVLIEAAALALARSSKLRFVSVGQGPLEHEMRSLVARSDIEDRFTILGYRRDAPAVIAAGDIFALASRHEGLPVALMEALALSRPVVATAVGGIPEAVTHGSEGLLVEPDRPDRLADAFVKLAEDSELREQMASRSAATGEGFGIESAQRRLEEIYTELAARRCS